MLTRFVCRLVVTQQSSLPTINIIGNIVRNMSGKHGTDDIGTKKLGDVKDPKQVSEDEWKKVLPPETFEVARKSGTEPAFSGAFDKFFEKGRYVCLCCGAELFNSDSKYWSGCGWPAFSKSIDNDLNIVRLEDNSHGRKRVECNAHLGHVFNDGPKDTGERYCINSVCMAFEKTE
ncbi:methionine-R-sulfoxide reductase [Dictyocaulus viviparus]|uniref:Peptide-methionine (R)-S-oxide reductase n=1 Tax=Dictyocaulus viviparus TaxID=29172 RepID=A0A0D8XYV9_DICVI|nr:methionine-R-sulfoxide reductase [Dictyocaulus viviparus]